MTVHDSGQSAARWITLDQSEGKRDEGDARTMCTDNQNSIFLFTSGTFPVLLRQLFIEGDFSTCNLYVYIYNIYRVLLSGLDGEHY